MVGQTTNTCIGSLAGKLSCLRTLDNALLNMCFSTVPTYDIENIFLCSWEFHVISRMHCVKV